MPTPLRVLILEDYCEDVELLLAELRRAGFDPDWQRVGNEADYLAHLNSSVDVILSDYRLPGFDALEALLLLRGAGLEIPFIVVTGSLGDEAAAYCMKQGATDYLLKDRLARLGPAVRQALEQRRLHEEKRQAEESTRQAEAKYRSIFENAVEGIFQTTWDGRFLTANPALARMLGYDSPEELIATITDSAHQLYVCPERRATFQRLLEEGDIVQGFEAQFYRKDGSAIWVWTNARAVRDGAGNLLYYEGTVEDVTERKRAEEARRESEERLAGIVNSAMDAIITIDIEQRIVLFNPAAECMFRCSAAEVVGQPLDRFIPERFRNSHRQHVLNFSETGVTTRTMGALGDLTGLRADGEEFPLEASISQTEIGGQKIFSVILRDISGRKRAEESLRQQLAHISLLNQIAHSIAEHHDLGSILHAVMGHLEERLPIDFGGVALYDHDAHTLTFVARGPKSRPLAIELGLGEGQVFPLTQTPFRDCVNGAMVAVTDIAAIDEVVPQKMAQAGLRSGVGVPLIVEDNVLGILTAIRRLVDGFSSEEREFLQQVAEHVALAAHHARLMENLQKAYDDLRWTQEAVMQQERLRALGQMASGIAHDINNALSPIIGYTELMLQDETDLSSRSRLYLETIRTAAADIANTVARTKEFYRQREESEIFLPFELNRVVQQAIDLTRAKWLSIPQERGIVIDVRTELQDDLPSPMGNVSEIREAITNLIFNAVDAMPQGGAISIRTRTEEIGELGNWEIEKPETVPISQFPNSPISSHVVLEVSDTGIGMDEETRQRCLEPFFTTKGERGTGLGLAMVFGIVQRHAGHVEIESAPAEGTTVRLVFPMREDVGAGVPASPEEIPPPLRILFIDDDPALSKVVRDMLTTDGHTVEVADGGQAGIEAYESAQQWGEPFDVVITDLGMPHVDGRAVAAAVKRASPTTPVILLTGWGIRLHAEGELPSNVDVVLSKPADLFALRAALRQVVARRPTE